MSQRVKESHPGQEPKEANSRQQNRRIRFQRRERLLVIQVSEEMNVARRLVGEERTWLQRGLER